jgi:hypothetical protein
MSKLQRPTNGVPSSTPNIHHLTFPCTAVTIPRKKFLLKVGLIWFARRQASLFRPWRSGRGWRRFPRPGATARTHQLANVAAWSPLGNLRSDVAMVYGIDKTLPDRVKSWRERGIACI